MPFIEIALAEGRTPQAKRALLAAVHSAVVQSLGVPDASVRIVLREVPLENWSSGGTTLAEQRGSGTAPPGPTTPDAPVTAASDAPPTTA